jgi:hypothetical protein
MVSLGRDELDDAGAPTPESMRNGTRCLISKVQKSKELPFEQSGQIDTHPDMHGSEQHQADGRVNPFEQDCTPHLNYD